MDHDISHRDVEMVYLSLSCLCDSVDEYIDLRKWSPAKHPTAGIIGQEQNGKLYLKEFAKSTPVAKVRAWRSRLRNARIILVNDTPVYSIKDLESVSLSLAAEKATKCRLHVAHSAIRDGLVESGIPQINIDQLNHRNSLSDIDVMTQEQYDRWFEALPPCFYEIISGGGVLNFTTECHKLTRRKLLQQDNWGDWQSSEHKQLDMYESQYLFGTPCKPTKKEAIFNLIWTYVLKLDGTKKSRCTCDGSTRGGQVRVLDHTFANALDQTTGRLFYAIAAAENLLVYGSDASNAFGEAPPPKQGFFIRPDQAFRDWWASKGRPPIPEGYVIPVLAAICRATRNRPAFGRSTSTKYFAVMVFTLPYMNHVFIVELLMVVVLSSSSRLTILLVQQRLRRWLTRFLISLMVHFKFRSNDRV